MRLTVIWSEKGRPEREGEREGEGKREKVGNGRRDKIEKIRRRWHCT